MEDAPRPDLQRELAAAASVLAFEAALLVDRLQQGQRRRNPAAARAADHAAEALTELDRSRRECPDLALRQAAWALAAAAVAVAAAKEELDEAFSPPEVRG